MKAIIKTKYAGNFRDKSQPSYKITLFFIDSVGNDNKKYLY